MDRIEELKHRISHQPSDPSLYYELAKAYIVSNALREAIQTLSKAVNLSPQTARYRLLLAKTYLKDHKYEHARKQYQKVLSLDPSNSRAHRNLALLFEFHLRDPQRALAHYQRYVDVGGNDPRILNRFKLLREEVQPAQSQDRPKPVMETENVAISHKTKVRDISHRLLGWRDMVASKISNKKTVLTELLFSLAMFGLLFLCFDAFPVADYYLTTIVCLGVAGLTALDPKFGIGTGLVLMFFPIAFYNALMGYLYAVGILVLLRMFRGEKPARLLVILLTPLFLKMNIAYAIPLGAAVWLGARPAPRMGIVACMVGLGYLIATNTHQLGPLSVNYGGIPIFMSSYGGADVGAFFSFHWMKSLISPKVIFSFTKLIRSLYPELLKPPVVLVEIVSWGFAGYAAGRLYQKREHMYLAALGIVAIIFFLQAMIIENVLGYSDFSPWLTAQCFLYSALAISVLTFFKVGIREKEPVKATTGAELAEDLEEISWDSIGGLEDVKKEIQMVTRYQFGHEASRFTKRFGLKGVKGILFYGPPGCGKTMFAKVLAKDVGASFFSIKGSDFHSKWFGESEQNLSNIFEKGRQNAPSVIFFDEIDSMLEKRGETTSGTPEREIVALFLTELDGLKPLRGVLVVGATNEPDLIDQAVLRPGRFDKLIYIPLPDINGRERIFRIHLRQKPLAGGIDFQKLARMTERFSGADIADVCSKVAEQAMQESLRLGQTMAISMAALEAQIRASKPSVSLESLRKYEELQEKYNRRTLKSETKPSEEKAKHTWDQIGGLDEVKQELMEAIETPLKKPQLYEMYKITPPKGVLLYGPSGCGKTLMVKTVANQCHAHFLSVDIKKETGEGIKKWFLRARETKPSILFFDEIDSIAASRDLGPMANHEVITQLLVELDGMEELKQVIVIAATNRPDSLDSALMRPGRFDRLIYIPPPDEKSRMQILKIHFKGKPLAKDINLSMIAEKTRNYSGADLSALCYEASMSLIRKSGKQRPEITMADISSAMERVKSSLSAEDLAYFDEMRARYFRGTQVLNPQA